MLPYIALGIFGLLAFKAQSAPKAAMTPTQRMIFQNALTADPPLTGVQLRTLATQYDAEGHTAEADILIRRARIAELPDEQKATLRNAFKAGLNQKDPIAVRALANAFEAEGMFGNAAALRDYANGLDVAATIQQTANIQQAQEQEQAQPTVVQAVGQAVGNAVNTAVQGAATAVAN